MDTTAECRRLRREARHAAVIVGLFAVIGSPAVLVDGASHGGLVLLAPAVAVAAVWLVLAGRMVGHARRWAGLPDTPVGLRAGLESARAVQPARVLDGLCLFFAAWVPFKLQVDWAIYAAQPWRAVIGIGGFVLIAGAVRWAFSRERRSFDARIATIP